MNPRELDGLLARESRRALPPAPDLRSAVRREISLRQGRSIWSHMFPVLHWQELMVIPRFATAAIALALIAGIVPSVLVTQLSANDDVEHARSSLHLKIFRADHGHRGGVLFPASN